MNNVSILLIEDHQDFRKAVRQFLELSQVRADIIEASTGEEGVFLARRKKPKVVVTDYYLGGINGLETAKQIKNLLPECIIIMLTIYDPKEIFRKDGDKTTKFFISKGDLHEQLVPVINKILS